MAAGVIIVVMALFIIGYLAIDELTMSRPDLRQTASSFIPRRWQYYVPALLGLLL